MNHTRLIVVTLVLGGISGCGKPSTKVEKPSWFKGEARPGQKASPEEVKEQIEAAQAKIKKIETTRASNQKLLDRCVKDKEEIVAKLKKAGVKSSADVTVNPKAKRYTDELLRVAKDTEPLERIDGQCEEAIGKLKSLVRHLEASLVLEDSGITDKELAELSGEIMKLDEKQGVAAGSDAGDPLKLDALLKKELDQK